MLNLQREYVDVAVDSRGNPRIEFHFPVTIIGVDAQARIIDFSVSGFYIETEAIIQIRQGKKINLALKLPGETASITIKAEVVHVDTKGFGCKFDDLTPEKHNTLTQYFVMYSEMLPVE